MRIVLHIGLHKTASTFLQWEVFSSFHKTPLCQDSCVLYNPKSLLKSLSEISYLENIYNGKIPDKEKEKYVQKNLKNLTDILNDKKFRDKETLFISYEIMSQSLLYLNYKEHFNLIRDIFKAAEIIVFLRYQSDFILSSYRQLLHNKRTTVSIKKFLNFRNGEFGSANEPNISSININKINYHELLGDYINYYGRKNVHIYFYEYFGKETVNSLFRILQVDVPENINFKKPINKGFSALAIQLTILKEKILQYLKIRPNNNNPQPINMFNMPLNTARKKKNIIFIFFLILYKIYWNLLRASRAPLGSWRGFVQKIFDRIIYIDWNILKSAGIDILLDNKFKSDNLKLLEFIDRKDIPKKYLE